jgi:hypothetical protein
VQDASAKEREDKMVAAAALKNEEGVGGKEAEAGKGKGADGVPAAKKPVNNNVAIKKGNFMVSKVCLRV